MVRLMKGEQTMKKNKLATVFSLASVLIILLPFYAFGGRYIVDSTTSSTNWDAAGWTNYPDPPTCTPVIPKTAMANAVAGDIVYFRGGAGGNYNFDTPEANEDDPVLGPAHSGTEGSPITFRNYPEELPVLTNTRNLSGNPHRDFFNIIGSTNQDWIVIDGFKIQGVNVGAKVRFNYAEHCIVQNCEIVGVKGHLVGNYDGIRSQSAHYLHIRNVKIHGYVTGNRHGAGVKNYGGHHIIVEHSTMYGNDCDYYDKSGGHHNIVRYNFMYDEGTDSESGPSIGWSEDSSYGCPYDMKAYQNIIRKGNTESDYAFIKGGGSNCGTRFTIYNNTIYLSPGSPQGFNWDWALDDGTDSFFNNVMYHANSSMVLLRHKSGILGYSDYNIFHGADNFENDGARYVSISDWQNNARTYYGGHPDRNSYYESITWGGGSGISSSSDSTDFKFTAPHKNYGRNAEGYSSVIGAYITGNEQIGYTPSAFENPPIIPPAEPTGLEVIGAQ